MYIKPKIRKKKAELAKTLFYYVFSGIKIIF